jgi:hypothetical protein
MNKVIIISFLMSVFCSEAMAHNGPHADNDSAAESKTVSRHIDEQQSNEPIIIAKTSHNVRLLKKIPMNDGKIVYLTVRDEGHVLGQNFVVQLRASCSGEVEDFSNLEIIDSLSVCNMKPESVKTNRQLTAVAFLSKTANINKYYDDLSSGKTEPKVDCNLKTEIQKFSLRKICADKPKS